MIRLIAACAATALLAAPALADGRDGDRGGSDRDHDGQRGDRDHDRHGGWDRDHDRDRGGWDRDHDRRDYPRAGWRPGYGAYGYNGYGYGYGRPVIVERYRPVYGYGAPVYYAPPPVYYAPRRVYGYAPYPAGYRYGYGRGCNAAPGVAIGAVTGGLLGTAANGRHDATGTVVGGVLGAIAGGAIASSGC